MFSGFLTPEIMCVDTVQRKGRIVRNPSGSLTDRVRVRLNAWVPNLYSSWQITQFQVFICTIVIRAAMPAVVRII